MRLRICFTLFAFALASVANAESPKRPNVLFISFDDMNDWTHGLGGHPQAQTPNMDRLEQRGTLFANAHCQAPLCNPSRTSLFTGRRPSTTGVYALDPWFRSAPQLADIVTMPQYFQRAGYTTIATGKNYHDAYPPKDGRKDGAEFSTWGFFGGSLPHPKQKFVHTPQDIKLMDWGIFPDEDNEQDDWKVADYAIDRLKQMPKDKPFMLCVGFRHPHVPLYATKKWWDKYPLETLQLPPVKEDDRDDVPPFAWYLHWKLPEPRLKFLKEADQWKNLVRAYLASITLGDHLLGRVLDAAEAAGFNDSNTIVVVWSDHGWHLGEKGITGKNTLWERSTHVPVIFAGPGVTAGQRCTRPVELLDLYPTLAELCGLPAPQGVEGHSIVPQLKDAKAPREWPAITTHGQNNHTVRTERYRYIRYVDGSQELYDMQSDPNEWTNLAKDPKYAAVIEAHKKWLPATNVPPIPGSKTRLVELKDGVVWWEGQPVGKNDPIPQ